MPISSFSEVSHLTHSTTAVPRAQVPRICESEPAVCSGSCQLHGCRFERRCLDAISPMGKGEEKNKSVPIFSLWPRLSQAFPKHCAQERKGKSEKRNGADEKVHDYCDKSPLCATNQVPHAKGAGRRGNAESEKVACVIEPRRGPSR